jgi:hypothetical protein
MLRLNSTMFRAFNPEYGRKVKIETAISDGGVIGVDTKRPRACSECIYRGRKNCPAMMRGGNCTLTPRVEL